MARLAGKIKGYSQWRKALWADDELAAIAVRARANRGAVDIRAVAEVVALYGANGRGCFASADTVAKHLRCNRQTIGKYRDQLVTLGWFVVTGKNCRVPVLSIALPDKGKADAEVIGSSSAGRWPCGCEVSDPWCEHGGWNVEPGVVSMRQSIVEPRTVNDRAVG